MDIFFPISKRFSYKNDNVFFQANVEEITGIVLCACEITTFKFDPVQLCSFVLNL